MPVAIKKLFACGLIIGSIIFAALIIADKQRSFYGLPGPFSDNAGGVKSENLPVSGKNLTEEATRGINDEISSYSAADLMNPKNHEKIAEKYLDEAAKNFDYDSLKPAALANRLNIVTTSDKRMVAIYIKGFNDAMNSVFGDLLKTEGDDLQKNLESLSLAYGRSIEALYAMTVPQIFGALHEKTVANLSGQKAATEIILQDYQTDPIRALFALQAVTKFNEELKTIRKGITELANKNS